MLVLLPLPRVLLITWGVSTAVFHPRTSLEAFHLNLLPSRVRLYTRDAIGLLVSATPFFRQPHNQEHPGIPRHTPRHTQAHPDPSRIRYAVISLSKINVEPKRPLHCARPDLAPICRCRCRTCWFRCPGSHSPSCPMVRSISRPLLRLTWKKAALTLAQAGPDHSLHLRIYTYVQSREYVLQKPWTVVSIPEFDFTSQVCVCPERQRPGVMVYKATCK